MMLNNKKKAFTLAEVLITLGILGVVAAITIPNLMININEKYWNHHSSIFERKLGEALRAMNSQAELCDGYTTTKEFVNQLSKHIKITKICDSDKLAECFPEKFQKNNKTYNVSDLTQASDIYTTEDYGTEVIGVMFADGVIALVAHNPKCTQDPFNSSSENAPVKITGSINGKQSHVTFSSDAISILYDINALAKPNEFEEKKDIRGNKILLK